ncbi:MAG: hypothetical protein KDE28_07850, partial [Anaerolineales bacterium]|nr:hypothetical protein [Anaerolineales bacterium]
MFKKLVRRVLGDPNKKVIDSLEPMVVAVTEAEDRFHELSDEELRNETVKLRERVQAGETLEDVLVEAFALVRVASQRTTGLRHYEVQLMGGNLLHRGEVIEMRTGEGKTL